ncbi:serine hydrolase [Saccharopolyspora sp. NPDC000995]
MGRCCSHQTVVGGHALVHVYSVGKPFTALTLLKVLADTGIALDTLVAELTGRRRGGQVSDHTASAAQPPGRAASVSRHAGDLFDDAGLRAQLAAPAPEWPPGTALAERGLTCGHLLDGVVRAVTGHSLGGRAEHRRRVPDVAPGAGGPRCGGRTAGPLHHDRTGPRRRR